MRCQWIFTTKYLVSSAFDKQIPKKYMDIEAVEHLKETYHLWLAFFSALQQRTLLDYYNHEKNL